MSEIPPQDAKMARLRILNIVLAILEEKRAEIVARLAYECGIKDDELILSTMSFESYFLALEAERRLLIDGLVAAALVGDPLNMGSDEL